MKEKTVVIAGLRHIRKTDDVGNVYYYYNGRPHNENGPAIIKNNGDKEWYNQGELHRRNCPAVECADGTKKWYRNGQLYRVNEPAIEWANGDKEWFVYGERHRIGAPAIARVDGSEEWYRYGKLHNETGPAIKTKEGKLYYYLEGNNILKEEFTKVNKVIINGKVHIRKDIEGLIKYYCNGQLHREDGQAAVFGKPNEDVLYYKNGRLHREDGPALEGYDGFKEWYKNGDLHNENGPAQIDGDMEAYYLDGDYYTEGQWKKEINKRKKRIEREKS